MTKKLSAGTIHDKLPPALISALAADSVARDAWQGITPLARNEWICWIESPKTEATRQNHIERTVKELSEGVRRPCCWIGCIHRTDKAISPSVKAILAKRSS